MVLEVFESTVDTGLIYDVGMHVGVDTEFYLKKGFRVIAFEANPELIAECKLKFAEYISSGQLVIVEGAILDSVSIMEMKAKGQHKVRFYKNEDESVWGTVNEDWAKRNEGLGTKSTVIEVDIVDFTEVLKSRGMPHYMKIDIEGSDLDCVRALRNFSSRPNYLSIESDKTGMQPLMEELELLRDLGYDRFQAVEQGSIHIRQSPPRPAREGESIDFIFEAGASGLFGAELDGEWKTFSAIASQYRWIQLGYKYFGDDGICSRWKFKGSGRISNLLRKIFSAFIGNDVPGWYDTHARHGGVRGWRLEVGS